MKQQSIKQRFFEFCRSLDPFVSSEIFDDVETKLSEKNYKKGSNLLKEGEYCSHVFFVGKGLLKNGYWKDDREYIVRFCEENYILTDLESIYTNSPSKLHITAIEDSEVLSISYRDMESLLKKHHSLERMTRLYHEKTLTKTMSWTKEILGSEAKEIYLKFIEENAELSKRISLGDLSSYLGISQVSLSRIRASLTHSHNRVVDYRSSPHIA